ncbi:MAG: methylenetetrahydrofolate reductase [Actinobacteria bacterium]|nr:methylenetetrahydrofolate reductase [Actinomycetota bacterium]
MVGYVDAVNVTDNPTASAHMSPLAGARFVAGAGIEPTVQLTCRDRNRLGITGDLLGAWALGARNLLCLTGDPIHIGDHPDARVVHDLTVAEVVTLAKRLREEGTNLSGGEITDPPRFLIGVADVPLADPYEPARLEAKLDAGADFVMTQIVYDIERLASWAEGARARGLFERAKVIVGVTPLQSAKQARFMDEKLPGVHVPVAMVKALEAAGEEAAAVGTELTVEIVRSVREIDGVAGIHLMGMGHDAIVRAVVDRAGLFPRPTA